MNKLYLLVASFIFIGTAVSQVSSTPLTSTPSIITSLKGPSVSITGLTIGGSSRSQLVNALGSFNGGKSNLNSPNIGLESGFVITTGSATNTNGTQTSSVRGPNNGDASIAGDPADVFSDPDLQQVTELEKYDLKFITFTIVPTASVLTGTIVFASEEYPVYVGSQYNDVSAIIIDGPGIVSNGAYSNLDGNPATGSRNLAVFANGASMTINQVNSGVRGSQSDGTAINATNNEFYVRNYSSTNDATATGVEGNLPNLQPNGFTRPMTFRVTVIPGQSYRMKIAIADVGDGSYDSALFFKLISSNNGQRDFGDLPATYNAGDRQVVSDNATTLGVLGFQSAASHVIPDVVNLYLGSAAPVAEANGQPQASAAGDAEEGGIIFSHLDASSTSLTATIPYYNNTGVPANITGWMDINRDGIFTSNEGSTVITPVTNGVDTATLTFTGLSGLTLGQQYFLRFRTSTETISLLDVGGELLDGEVEDYMATVTFPLPVSFASLNASVRNCDVILDWKTASESNSMVYAVEWSNNGTTYTEISRVPSKNQAEGAAYQYRHTPGETGMNYYRLKAIDFDGGFEYSKVVSVSGELCGGVLPISISPNPVSTILTVKGLQATDRVSVLDMSGNPVRVSGNVVSSGRLDTGSIGAGVYVLKIAHANGRETILRFVKK